MHTCGTRHENILTLQEEPQQVSVTAAPTPDTALCLRVFMVSCSRLYDYHRLVHSSLLGPPSRTRAVLGRRRSGFPAAQHQQEADGLAQVQVAPAGQRAVPGRVGQVRDRHRREIHEILALRLHHLHHGDDGRRLSGSRTTVNTL